MIDRKDDTTPFRMVLEIIGAKWMPMVVYVLSDGDKRYNDIKSEISEISSKVLTQTLKRMTEQGLVVKSSKDDADYYSLSQSGRKFIEPLVGLCNFAKSNFDELNRIIDLTNRKI